MPEAVPRHKDLTIFQVALAWIGFILMIWGIVCAFRLVVCGVVLALTGAISYIIAVRTIQVPLDMRHQTK
ncbi:MAG: hypothetical protein QXO01_07280 [Nitrososphaerota archaeon]